MRSVIACLIFACLELACSDRTETASRLNLVAYQSEFKWKKANLSVCWELGSDETLGYRAMVQAAVIEAFAGTPFTFEKWSLCDGNVYDLHFFIYDDFSMFETAEYKAVKKVIEADVSQLGLGHPRARGFGTENYNEAAGVTLNRSFLDSVIQNTPIYQNLGEQGRIHLSISVALHEIGHALNLVHEDSHSGISANCASYAEPVDPIYTIEVTPYNQQSFMSRCYYRPYDYNQGIIFPNAADISGINLMYANLLPPADDAASVINENSTENR